MKTGLKHSILALTVLPALAAAPPPEGPPRPDPLAESLFPPELVLNLGADIGLRAEELDAIRSVVEKAGSRFEELHRSLEKETGALHELLRKERVEEAAALSQFDKVQGLEREIKRAQLALVIGIKNRLTPEQQSRLREIKRLVTGPQAAIPSKMERVKAGVERWQRDGRDPSPIGEIMKEFDSLMQGRKFREADAVLDRALKMLEGAEKNTPSEKKERVDAFSPPPIVPPVGREPGGSPGRDRGAAGRRSALARDLGEPAAVPVR